MRFAVGVKDHVQRKKFLAHFKFDFVSIEELF